MKMIFTPREERGLLKNLIVKYKHIISYLFFGVCTTAVNLIVYYVSAHSLQMSTGVSTVIAWVLAVLFAFITNKLWVFDCKSWERKVVTKEIASFFACRAATGVLDLVIMLVSVDVLHWNDFVMKIISNILVIILNYVASKLVIFRKDSK